MPHLDGGESYASTAQLAIVVEPTDILAIHAGALMALRTRSERPSNWLVARFASQVDEIRAHLEPIRTSALLAESFRRESAHLLVTRRYSPDDAERVVATSPVDVAYAMRWLELTDGVRRGPWGAWLKA